MDLLGSILLGIIEGITEFLPISSTGHLILASEILGIEQTSFVKDFEIIIQLGAILAIVFLYFNTLIRNKKVWLRVLSAFIPTAVIGYILYHFIKNYLLGNSLITVLALFIGGIILIILELIYKEKEHHAERIEDLSLRNSFLIGIFQSISIIPGVSRSAATIIGALFLGAKRKTAVEFSFLLAVPTMLAASVLDVYKSGFLNYSSSEIFTLIIGFIVSFIVAIFAVKFFLNFIKNHTFIPFAIYRIILAILFWIFILY